MLARPTILSLLRDKQLSTPIRERIAFGSSTLMLSKSAEWDLELLSLLRDEQLDAFLCSKIVLGLLEAGRYWLAGSVWLEREERKKQEKQVTQRLLSMLKSEPSGTYLYDSLVLAIAARGEPVVKRNVLLLLKERRYPSDFSAFYSVIKILEDQKLVPDLLSLLTDRQQSSDLRQVVASTLEGLIDDNETTAQLASYVPRLYIDNAIYDSLWRLSRRTGVKIPMRT
jgi:hypothetical protein